MFIATQRVNRTGEGVASVAVRVFDTGTGLAYTFSRSFQTDTTRVIVYRGQEQLTQEYDDNAILFASEFARGLVLRRQVTLVDRASSKMITDLLKKGVESYE